MRPVSVVCQLDATRYEAQGSTEVEERHLRSCRLQVCARRTRILRPIEMLRMKGRVVLGIPLRGSCMQCMTFLAKQGRQDRFLHERMGEQECIAVRPHEPVRNQRLTGVVRSFDEKPQCIFVKALSKHGRCAHRPLIRGV